MGLFGRVRTISRAAWERALFALFCLFANHAYGLGDYKHSLDCAVRACELARRQFGEGHRLYGCRLHMLGLLYSEVGDYARAEGLLLQSLEITSATQGAAHANYAAGLHVLGSLYNETSRYEEARPLYERALEIRRALGRAARADVARTLLALGSLHSAAEDLDAAERCYREAAEIHDRIYRRYSAEAVSARSAVMNNMGAVHSARGLYAEAEGCYREALRTARVARGKAHPSCCASMFNLARLYRDLGRYGEAESFASGALEIRRRAYGDRHPAVAPGLSLLGGVSQDRGDYAAAERHYLSALRIVAQALGEEHPKVAQSLNQLGLLYFHMGRYAESEDFLRRSLEILLPKWGDEHYSLVAPLSNLALLYRKLARYEEARELYLRAQRLIVRGRGEEHPAFAHNIASLAQVCEATGDYEEAGALFRRSHGIELRAFGASHPQHAHTLGAMAHLEETAGNYTEAEALYKRSLDVSRRALGESHPNHAAALNNLGELYLLAGRYDEAATVIRRAMETMAATLGEGHPSFLLASNNMAFLYVAIGDHERAEAALRECAGAMREVYGEEHPEYATTLHNLATLYAELGRYAEAAPLCEESYKIRAAALGPEHPACAYSLNTLGLVLAGADEYDDAEECYREAHAVAARALGEGHPVAALSRGNLAQLYLTTGRYGEAEPVFLDTMRAVSRVLGDAHPMRSVVAGNLALLYAVTGRAAEAVELLEEVALSEERMIDRVFSLASERQRMCYLASSQAVGGDLMSLVLRRFGGAGDVARRACDLVLRRKGLGAEALAAQRDAVLGGRYPHLADALRELRALRVKSAGYQMAMLRPGAPPAYAESWAECERNKEEIEAALADQIQEIRLTQRMREATADKIARALPEGSALVEFVRFDEFDFGTAPARGESPLRPAVYAAFVIPSGLRGRAELVELGDAALVDGLISRYEEGVLREAALDAVPRAGEEGNLAAGSARLGKAVAALFKSQRERAGAELRRTVFDPLLPTLGNSRRIFLAPDGGLTMLPFETLPAAGGRYLIDDYHFSYLSTGRDLLRWVGVQPSSRASLCGEPLVAGNPDFELCGVPHGTRVAGSSATRVDGTEGATPPHGSRGPRPFLPLPETAEECERVASMIGCDPLLWDAVLERDIKSRRSPGIIHIATHGFFPEGGRRAPSEGSQSLMLRLLEGQWMERGAPALGARNPMLQSGLALAGANSWSSGAELPEAAEDGLLTAADVSGLDLLDTELVTLSACHTGRGVAYTGEGVFGLRRAFELAGARTLVISLWKVPSKETRSLMEQFYERIIRGQPRAEALRAAQLALRESGSESPLFWGGFICQGDPYALPSDLLKELPAAADRLPADEPHAAPARGRATLRSALGSTPSPARNSFADVANNTSQARPAASTHP